MLLDRRLPRFLKNLPFGWVQANIHSSLLFTLGTMVIGLLFISNLRPGLAEFRTLTLTLPAIWVISLAVRIAAQHLAIGRDSLDVQTRLGPTGNLSTDYEFLRPVQILKYSLAGHAASLMLVALGLMVSAAVLPVGDSAGAGEQAEFRLAPLLDIHGGWSSLAWASQIMWVNLLIACLNLLPTVPFDNRSLLYGLALIGRRKEESAVLRNLAQFNSHLAAFLVGVGLAVLAISILYNLDSMGWYAMMAAGVYLFVASRWEFSRALQLEQQCVTLGNSAARERHHKHHGSRHFRFTAVETRQSELAGTSLDASETSSDVPSMVVQEKKMQVSDAYLDEILRKLHREGTSSLSVREQEALLTASEKLKEKHRSRN